MVPHTSSLSSLLITASFSCTIFSDMIYRLLSNGWYHNFILSEICKSCLFLCVFQFAKLIVPYIIFRWGAICEVLFSYHKTNLQTGKFILHQFEGLHKLWDTPDALLLPFSASL